MINLIFPPLSKAVEINPPSSASTKTRSSSPAQPTEPAFASHLQNAISVITPPSIENPPEYIPKTPSSDDTQQDQNQTQDQTQNQSQSQNQPQQDSLYSPITPSSAIIEPYALSEKPSVETYELLLDSIWEELSDLPASSSGGVEGLAQNLLLMLLSMHPDLQNSDNTMDYSMNPSMGSLLLAMCGLTEQNADAPMDCVRALIEKLPTDQAEILRQSLMNSNQYSNETLDIVSGLFPTNTTASVGSGSNNSSSYATVSAGNGNYPYEAWRKCDPAIVSTQQDRSAQLYRDVIDQFNVETNGRYAVNKRGTGDTYCNIFLWDVTSAMNAEIPHYIDKETKQPRTYPDTKGAMELNANATYDWLKEYGSRYGWVEVTPQQAQLYANQGRPAVTAKKNPGGIGHVQVVCPSADGTYDPIRGVTISQAGSRLRNYTYISEIYGKSLSQVSYFVHL